METDARHRFAAAVGRVLGPTAARRLREVYRGVRGAGRRGAAAAGRLLGRPQPSRQEQIDALGRAGNNLHHGRRLDWVSPDPFAGFAEPAVSRHWLLENLHRLLEPRSYFEIGVATGDSLALSRARTIAVDPVSKVTRRIEAELRFFEETSDDFFARDDAFAHFEGAPVDLAFIDGMHLSEYALRDFVNTEPQLGPGSVVVIDDVMPRNELEAYRIRRTGSWAGDVYKIIDVLARERPDLTVVLCNTKPTGTLVVLGFGSGSTRLRDRLDALTAGLQSDDPQTVPEALLLRRSSVDPVRLLALPFWKELAAARDAGAGREEIAGLVAGLRAELPAIAAPPGTELLPAP